MNIWLRITKAAGTSFADAIKHHNIRTFTVTKDNINTFNSLNLNDSFIFSIIRNPYEKGVSSYKWLTTGGGSKRFNKLNVYKNCKSYEDFLKISIDLRNEHEKYDHKMLDSGTIISNKVYPVGTVEYEYFWAVQHLEGLYDTITTFVPLDKIDLLIKLENFNEEKKKLESTIGKPINLGHLNKTRDDRSFIDFYNDDVIIPFMELYNKDVEIFDYELR